MCLEEMGVFGSNRLDVELSKKKKYVNECLLVHQHESRFSGLACAK